jgi:hypothetical protein
MRKIVVCEIGVEDPSLGSQLFDVHVRVYLKAYRVAR